MSPFLSGVGSISRYLKKTNEMYKKVQMISVDKGIIFNFEIY